LIPNGKNALSINCTFDCEGKAGRKGHNVFLAPKREGLIERGGGLIEDLLYLRWGLVSLRRGHIIGFLSV